MNVECALVLIVVSALQMSDFVFVYVVDYIYSRPDRDTVRGSVIAARFVRTGKRKGQITRQMTRVTAS